MWTHQGKEPRGRPNLRWKDASKRDMKEATEAVLKEDNTTNRAEWRKKQISYAYRRPQMTGQARDEEVEDSLS